MSIENDILARLSKWYAEPNDPDAWEIDLMSEAVDVIMPLVKRAQAEALREATTWVENLAAHDGLMYRDDGHGDSVATSIPDALRDRANRIEKEAGHDQ